MAIISKVVYIAVARGIYKIGHSKNPSKRMLSVKHACRVPGFRLGRKEHPIIVWTIPITTPRTEKALHWLFRRKCAAGEWFNLDEQDLSWIATQTEQSILLAANAELDRVQATPRGKRYKEMYYGHWQRYSEGISE